MLESAELAAASMWRAVVQKKLEQVSVGVGAASFVWSFVVLLGASFRTWRAGFWSRIILYIREMLDNGRTTCAHIAVRRLMLLLLCWSASTAEMKRKIERIENPNNKEKFSNTFPEQQLSNFLLADVSNTEKYFN